MFIYLRGVKKTSQLASALKSNKGLIYRILKLQRKWLVEITLESPTCYVAVPFEKIIDYYIQLKREEAARNESEKQELLSDWKNIVQPEHEVPLEKFSGIEDQKKIFQKICRMVKMTKK
jgi:sugar-specific transcriptional regulator TrmB